MKTIFENLMTLNKECALSNGAMVISFVPKLMLTELLMHFGDCIFLDNYKCDYGCSYLGF